MKVKKAFIMLAAAGLLMTACQTQSHREAQAMLDSARMACDNQCYQEALNTIERLRSQYPDEIEVRKEALKLFQDASLKMAQADLAQTDSLLQAANAQYEAANRRATANRQALRATEAELHHVNELRKVRDSLQVRFDMQCAKIKYIHKKQKE